MKYREMIKKVQLKSGFSDQESRDSLQLLIESLAIRLNEGERRDFASQLPEELQDIALSVSPPDEKLNDDLIAEVSEIENISQDHAKKQILSSWEALKEAITPGAIRHIKAQLPNKTAQLLY